MTILFRWMLCLLFVGNLAQAQIQPEARAYLDKAMEALQQHFIRREQVDWTGLRERVYEAAHSAKVPADTKPTLLPIKTRCLKPLLTGFGLSLLAKDDLSRPKTSLPW